MSIFTSRVGFPWRRVPSSTLTGDERPAQEGFDEAYRQSLINLAWKVNPHAGDEGPLYRARVLFSLDFLSRAHFGDFSITAHEFFRALGNPHEIPRLSDEAIAMKEDKLIDLAKALWGEQRLASLDSDVSSGRHFSLMNGDSLWLDIISSSLIGEIHERKFKRIPRNRLLEVIYRPRGGREKGQVDKAYIGHVSRIGKDSFNLRTSEGHRTLRFDRVKDAFVISRKGKLADGPVYRLMMTLEEYDRDSFALVISYGHRDDPRLSRVKEKA